MRQIKTRTHLALKNKKTLKVDTQKLCFEEIGQDEAGNYILHKSREINMGSGYGEESEYYLLDAEDLKRYGIKK